MTSNLNRNSLLLRSATIFLFASLSAVAAHAQGDDARNPADFIDPNMGASSNGMLLSAAGSHVFVSVRDQPAFH